MEEHTAKLALPGRELHSALRRTSLAARTLFAFMLGMICVELFWPEPREEISIRPSVVLGLIVAQLSAALMHVVGQSQCASLPVSEAQRAARQSARAGAGFVSLVFLGGVLPGDTGLYAISVAFLLLIVATFFWQIFLRSIADRLEFRDLRPRINRLVWWACIAVACLLYRIVALDRAPPFVGSLCGVVLLVCVAVYARLISTIAARAAERTPTA